MTDNYHIKGLLGPEFEESVDIWVTDGKLTFNEIQGAHNLKSDGAMFILPGLVDTHVHLTMNFDLLQQFFREKKPYETSYLSHEYIQEKLDRHMHSGELLLRDIGEIRNMHHERFGQEHLVTLQAAGQFLAPEGGFFPFVEKTPTDELVSEALKQVELGYPWVKIIGDWEKHPLNYEEEAIYQLVNQVHKAGGRVAMHAETVESSTVAINAGVDSIEHGEFLTKEQIDVMADHNTAWTPTAAIFDHFLSQHPGHPSMQPRWDSLKQLVPYGQEQGVKIMTGTDMFPPGSVHLEVMGLIKLGLTPEHALQAATTSPRTVLRQPGIEEGAPADLVLYRSNPIDQIKEINNPGYVFAKGKMVHTA